MRFKIGDNVIYPAHGLAKVKRIDSRRLNERETQFYVLETDHGLTIMAPIGTEIGLRAVASRDEALEAIKAARKVLLDTGSTWNRRYRDYMERLKSGQLIDALTVLRSLVKLRDRADLSFGERKMLDSAKELVTAELRLALGTELAVTKAIEDLTE